MPLEAILIQAIIVTLAWAFGMLFLILLSQWMKVENERERMSGQRQACHFHIKAQIINLTQLTLCLARLKSLQSY